MKKFDTQGIGFGLTISNFFALSLGNKSIEVTSDKKGTCFTFWVLIQTTKIKKILSYSHSNFSSVNFLSQGKDIGDPLIEIDENDIRNEKGDSFNGFDLGF